MMQVGAGRDWPLAGGDVGGTYFSRLEDITPENVSSLGLAWDYPLYTNRGQEATPVEIDGVLVTSSTAGRAVALDAATGEEIWRFDPEIDMQANRVACCDMVNRGVAVDDGRVFVATLDGVLYALDFKSGEILWQADTHDGSGRGLSSTGAPEVAGDVVLIGNSGAEYDVRGFVTAYDVETGAARWRFYTVPHDPEAGPQENPELEEAVTTWDPESRWDVGGGGTVWDAIHYDPEFDAVYIGVGNGGPYHRAKRSPSGGDNLYLSSIVALDPETGRVKWHYQETPGDSWDFTATGPMTLTTLEIDGEETPVLLHAPKNGFLYVIDRRNGKLLRANALVFQNWTSGINAETGRPVMTPENADYSTGPKIIYPGTPGASNWHPFSYNPQTGLYYGAVLEMGNLMMMTPGQKPYKEKGINSDASLIFTPDLPAVLPGLPSFVQEAVKALPEWSRVEEGLDKSELRAIDPLTGETVWAAPYAGWQDRSGVLTTASGLVFAGDVRGFFNVYDAESGDLLKSIDTGASIIAAPMTYEVDGVQYVAVMAGWGGGGWPYVPRYGAAYERRNDGRILVFKLGGGETPKPDKLPPLEPAPAAPEDLFADASPETIAHGRALFFDNCAICHSNQHRSISPDLRRMQPYTHEIFNDILLEGLLVQNGMPSWGDLLMEEDADAIHAYLIGEQRRIRAVELELQKEGLPLDQPSAALLSNY
ncbi:PQQ-dependent dehydrogenase, methanol/ethanol family [Marinicaulis flavus]|uniref:PQQ-dependent dehydrogenase, methanol/ethanol family n=2 Tax=Hyphococcus luteus TaxID=2058213 RepID=A0A2S7K246_9PROT|nr:PQQ-dependent dehydrogenase, methanol/ethanol family [Marinicaulis flavus]